MKKAIERYKYAKFFGLPLHICLKAFLFGKSKERKEKK